MPPDRPIQPPHRGLTGTAACAPATARIADTASATSAASATGVDHPIAYLRLAQISRADLCQLAQGLAPAPLAGRAALAESLPPAFVAARSLAQLNSGTAAIWCHGYYVLDDRTATIVGSCGFKDGPVDGQVEIGYGMAPPSRSLGFATAAIQALIALARESGGATSVLAQVNAQNLASSRVVQKLRFEPQGQKLDHEGELLVQWVLRLTDAAMA